MHVAVVDARKRFLLPGAPGELAISGPQVTQGYLNDPELTRRRYPELLHPEIGMSAWYLTGDEGYQDSSGTFHFLGRRDNQVKYLGHRVELEEIEHHLREISGSAEAAVIAWPVKEGLVQGLVGFIGSGHVGVRSVEREMKSRFPRQLVPTSIVLVERMPRNRHGKIDRAQLRGLLEKAPTGGDGKRTV
jgi:acyl-coenzyme A synthetase/AMP-(fatty) acid ligase